MRTIVLIQHGQSHHHVNPQARLGPDSANGLTELGRRQAACLAARLQSEVGPVRPRIYTSDMRRAVETAQIIGRRIGQPARRVGELREWNGRFAVERTTEAKERNIAAQDRGGFDWRPFPEAETWREFFLRVSTCMDRLVQDHDPEHPALLVVHGGTLSNTVAWWLRLELDAMPERTPFAASPASITVLKTNRFGNPVLDRLNDTAHLYTQQIAGVSPLWS